MGYSWPGNVRQLENVVERAVALERNHMVQVSSLPAEMSQKLDAQSEPLADGPDITLPEAGLNLPQHLESQEREYVSRALHQCGGRHDRAARLLGISPRQFRYLLDKYQLR